MNLRNDLVEQLIQHKASEINSICVTDKTELFDHIIIASAFSPKHAVSIGNKVRRYVKNFYYDAPPLCGDENGYWVVVDAESVVVHIFSEGARDYYELDKFWTHNVELDA